MLICPVETSYKIRKDTGAVKKVNRNIIRKNGGLRRRRHGDIPSTKRPFPKLAERHGLSSRSVYGKPLYPRVFQRIKNCLIY